MKIFVDENIPVLTVSVLRDRGHDVRDIRGTREEGSQDLILWERAQKEGRLFITTDKGFSKHRDEAHSGILIIRLKQPNRMKLHQRVLQAMNQIPEQEWKGLLLVMQDIVQKKWRVKE